MSIKLHESGLLVFFLLRCVWNTIKKEGSLIYFPKKMVREILEIAHGLMAERNFGL